MMDDRLDRLTMIGLHKLAVDRADEMVPELHDLLLPRAAAANITQFPGASKRRRPMADFAVVGAPKGNILFFPAAPTIRAAEEQA